MMMIYIGRKCTYNRKKNTEGLVVAGKESGLEVNADKTKYTVMSRDRNAGRSHNIKIDNSSFGKTEEFKYVGTNLTNQNSIQEEVNTLRTGSFKLFKRPFPVFF